MKPEDYAKASSEFSQQVALFLWAALEQRTRSELRWLHAIKNEEKSGNVIAGARAKQSGIKAGVHDTFLPVKRGSFSGLYIEMKKPGGKPSDLQLEFGLAVQAEGFAWAVCDHWEIAKNTLVDYLEGRFEQKTYSGVKHRIK